MPSHKPDSDLCPQVPPDPRRQFGLDGERLAEEFLRRRGFKPVARRFATPVGELDLVMRDGETLVFIEVKARRDRTWAEPQESVRLDKQRKMARCAAWFINQKKWSDCPCRFDVVAVTLPASEAPEIVHFADAFLPPR